MEPIISSHAADEHGKGFCKITPLIPRLHLSACAGIEYVISPIVAAVRRAIPSTIIPTYRVLIACSGTLTGISNDGLSSREVII